MDKLREQFGLSQSDPLPAALLATAAIPAPSPNNDVDYGTMFVTPPTPAPVAEASLETLYAPSLPLETLPSISLETSYAPVAALPFDTLTDFSVEPVELNGFPQDEFSTDLCGSIEASAGEVISNNNKRRKLSPDDVVAV
jgi:hypothetical protein